MTVVDSAVTPVGHGWLGAELSTDPGRWRLEVPSEVADELVALARDVDPAYPDRVGERLPVTSRALQRFAAEVRSRLAGNLGMVLLNGFPLGDEAVGAYWMLGSLLGRPVSQTKAGQYVVEVADRGADISEPNQRGHRSASALPFHADRTDVIGLLCIRAAEEGGGSQVVSSKALHDIVLAERPDLLSVLYGPFPNDQRDEQREGDAAWIPLPVFSRTDGDFAARYVRRFIEGSQRHADAPRLTPRQVEAMDFLDEVLHRPEVSLAMDLRPGDLQLINNFHLLHARAAFRDRTGEGGRLLVRLWLSFHESPELPPEYAPLFGATGRGQYRGGVWPADVMGE